MEAADSLRTAGTAFEPDPRTQHALQDRHDVISQFELAAQVPEAVRIHFETAKNVFLYGWCVYRFHMVAEHYVYATLEIALRERLFQAGTLSRNDERPPSLRRLLKIARANGLIANERFTRRQQWTLARAQRRHSQEMAMRMIKEGIDEAEIDCSDVLPSADEIAFDWLDHLIQHLPDHRNMHAHGTGALYPTVLWTFEVGCELINQLFTDQTSRFGATGVGD